MSNEPKNEEQNTPEAEAEQEKSSCSLFSTKTLLGLAFVAIVALVIVDTLTTGYVKNAVDGFLEWIEDNAVAGIFLFALVYFVATIFFIPGSVLTLGAGFVFASAFGLGIGVAVGTLSVFLGAGSGALASFLVGRYLLREQIAQLSQKYTVFQALDVALSQNGLKIFLLLRLSPILPFNALNYIGGISAVSFRDYAIALFGILPGTILYVFLGASAGNLAESASSGGSNNTVTYIVVGVGAFFGILAVAVTTRYAKAELNRIVAEREAEMAAEGNDEEAAGETAADKKKDDAASADKKKDDAASADASETC